LQGLEFLVYPLKKEYDKKPDYQKTTPNASFNDFAFHRRGHMMVCKIRTENAGIVFSSQDCSHTSSSTGSFVSHVIKDLLYNPYRFFIKTAFFHKQHQEKNLETLLRILSS